MAKVNYMYYNDMHFNECVMPSERSITVWLSLKWISGEKIPKACSYICSWRWRMPKSRTLASDRKSLHELAHAVMSWALLLHSSCVFVDRRYNGILSHLLLLFLFIFVFVVQRQQRQKVQRRKQLPSTNMCKHTLQTVWAELRRDWWKDQLVVWSLIIIERRSNCSVQSLSKLLVLPNWCVLAHDNLERHFYAPCLSTLLQHTFQSVLCRNCHNPNHFVNS